MVQKFCPDCGAKIEKQDFQDVGEVVFRSDSFGIELNDRFNYWWHKGLYGEISDGNEVEIIGNIYENPELLEGGLNENKN